MVTKLDIAMLAKLKEIDSMRGALTPFLKSNRINYRTFKRILEKGHGRFQHVQKIRDAFAEMDKGKELSPEEMVVAIAEQCAMSVEELKAPKTMKAKENRQIAAYLLFKESRLSRNGVAEILGFGDYTSALWARDAISKKMDTEIEVRRRVWAIREKIQIH